MATILLTHTNLPEVGNFINYVHHARISSLFVLLSHARILSHFPLHCLPLASRLIPTKKILVSVLVYKSILSCLIAKYLRSWLTKIWHVPFN